jgi:hypothetical protein
LASKLRSLDRATKSSIFSPRSRTLTNVFFYKISLLKYLHITKNLQEYLLYHQDLFANALMDQHPVDSKFQ